MSSAASHRRRKLLGDPDIAPERGGRPRRSAEPVGLDRVRDDDDPAAPADTADGTAESTDTTTDTSADGAQAPTGRRARRKAKRAARKKAPWWELPVLVIVAILVAILVKTFLIQPFYIPSASMEKTLHGCEGCSGDRIIVNKPIYTVFRDPHPGDIVVFKAPSEWPEDFTSAPPSNPVLKGVRWFGQLVGVVPPDESDLVKRVIAIGGQTVKCCDADGNVQISDDGPNGQFHSLDDASYTFVDPGSEDFGALPFGPVTVPEDRLWVMGDHRNNSSDSRYNCGGSNPAPDQPVCSDGTEQQAMESTVPVDNVIGKAVLIAWPPSRWTTLGTPPTFENVPLPSAAGNAGLASLATVGPLGVGVFAAGTVGGWRRRRRRPPGQRGPRRFLRQALRRTLRGGRRRA
jgi:signal peptidase I